MDDRELRTRNRRVALGVLASMLALAGLTTAYAYATIDFRRQVDAVQPDARPMQRDLIMVAGLTVFAIGTGLIVYRWYSRKPG